MNTKSLPGNATFANAKPARVVTMNCPIRTTVTRMKVLRKYRSHGAPSQAVRKLSNVQGDRTLKLTASDVVWNAAQNAKRSGEIQMNARNSAPKDSSFRDRVLIGSVSACQGR